MTHLKKAALAGAIAGLMLGSGVASAHVSYNLAGNGTAGAAPADGANTDWSAGGPTGYAGTLPITWYAHVHNTGGVANSQTANSADAVAATVPNGIAVGAKAYKDGTTNWGHTADFALFKLEADAEVTISVSSDNSALRPAFGLWQGWDTGFGSRHGTYLSNGALNPMAANPFPGSAGINVVDPNAWAFAATQGTPGAPAAATLTRMLTAGLYTLAIGGYDGTVGGQHAYSTTISAAAVPVPAAVWLFGSALAGLVGAQRRRRQVPA